MAIELEAKRNDGFKQATRTLPFSLPMEGYENFLTQCDPRFTQLSADQVSQVSHIVLREIGRVFLSSKDDVAEQRRIFGWGNLPDEAEGVGGILAKINPLLVNESFRENPVAGFDQLAQTYLQIREIQLSTGSDQKSEIDEFIENELKIPANNHEVAWFLNFWALGENDHYKAVIFPVAEEFLRHSLRIVEPFAPTQNQTVALASLALSDACRILENLNKTLIYEAEGNLPIESPEEEIIGLISRDKQAELAKVKAQSPEEAQRQPRLIDLVKRNLEGWVNNYCLPDPSNPFNSAESFDLDSLPTEETEKNNPMHISGFFNWVSMYHLREKTFDTRLDVVFMLSEMIYQINDPEKVIEFIKKPEVRNYSMEMMNPSYGDVRRSIPIREHYKEMTDASFRELVADVTGNATNPVASISEEDRQLTKDIFKSLIKNVFHRNLQRGQDTLKALGINAGTYIPDNWKFFVAWAADKSFRSAHQIVSDLEKLSED